MRMLSKAECEEHLRRLIEFCKQPENECLMYNYMRTIEQIRRHGVENHKELNIMYKEDVEKRLAEWKKQGLVYNKK